MGRPFSAGRHGHVARRAGRDRGAHASRFRRARASGAGDAVNGKYEKKTVTVDAPRYQVVLVDTNLGSADMYEALNQDSRVKIHDDTYGALKQTSRVNKLKNDNNVRNE